MQEEFRRLSAQLVFGDSASVLAEERVATVQVPIVLSPSPKSGRGFP